MAGPVMGPAQNPNTSTTPAGTVEVPEEWKRIGFSGLFHIEVGIDDDLDPDELAARLPARVPFGTNSSWLAVSVDRERRTVTLVRKDAAAVCDLVFGRGVRPRRRSGE